MKFNTLSQINDEDEANKYLHSFKTILHSEDFVLEETATCKK